MTRDRSTGGDGAMTDGAGGLRGLLLRHGLARFGMFGVVGTVGVGVNTVVLWLGHTLLGLHYLTAAALATELAIIHNFLGNELITFAGEGDGPRIARFVRFQAISLTTIAGTLSILWGLVRLFGEARLLLWNLAAIGTMFVANFLLNRTFTWAASPRRAAVEE